MKKLFFIALCVAVLVAGSACSQDTEKKESKSQAESSVESTQTTTTEKEQTLGRENKENSKYYKNFPDVEDFAIYMGLDPQKDVVTLEDSANKLVLSLRDEEETDRPFNYAEKLKDNGYKLKELDATISLTLVLNNDKYVIEITLISDMKEYKKVHKELKNPDKLTNENLIFSIKKK